MNWLIWAIMSFLILAMGSFFLQGLRRIPADPPHKAVVTTFGKRTKKVKNEGWRFFPLFPYWYGYILVNVTKINYDLPPQLVRTPDMAELEIPVSLTWTPVNELPPPKTEGPPLKKDKNKEPKSGLINYLNAGGENGVKEIINDIVRERLREWAISGLEGPQTWEEALGAREEATNILLKSIAGEVLKPISTNFPTTLLLRFYDAKIRDFREKKIQSNKRDKENWGYLKNHLASLTESQKKTLIKEVEERKGAIAKMRQGNGEKVLSQLGIRLDRLNIDEIKPKGKLAESAEKMVMEQRETEGDKIRIQNVLERIKKLKKLGFSSEQALEIVQTERGKVTKNISETKLNLSAETRAMIEKIAPDILTRIFTKQGGHYGR
ncbi:SPFH domain-containing protein [Patescibacteria group bacterium]|nr:SPFH domain-containing protein [Patescibacteria group bacterium]MBU2220196.1 SPFH domain-containing protein [Patescibacteria group bacterium]MBU2264671.1 SPFH domain-containing protein [Patescibacteria group bacterium]